MIDQIRLKFEALHDFNLDNNANMRSPVFSENQTIAETINSNFMSVPVKNHAFRVSSQRPQQHRRTATTAVRRNQPNFALTTLEPLRTSGLPFNIVKN
jgi:hypothetical protein